jgi:hypothetical protein
VKSAWVELIEKALLADWLLRIAVQQKALGCFSLRSGGPAGASKIRCLHHVPDFPSDSVLIFVASHFVLLLSINPTQISSAVPDADS